MNKIKLFLIKLMTLFVSYKNRTFEISDFYLMVLTFIITYWVTKSVKDILKRHFSKESQNTVQVPNVVGGGFPVLVDDTEIAMTILTCISDQGSYLVKDPKVIQIIFGLTKEKLKNESLVITPNLIRFFALRLVNSQPSTLVRIGNLVSSTDNQVRLLFRVGGSLVAGAVASLAATLPYGILFLLIFFMESEYSGYKGDKYFETISNTEPITLLTENKRGNLVITGNNRQVQIYVPSKTKAQIERLKNSQKLVSKKYIRLPRKAKQVKLEDFRKNDPVLSKFADLPEPYVPQQVCGLQRIPEYIADVSDER